MECKEARVEVKANTSQHLEGFDPVYASCHLLLAQIKAIRLDESSLGYDGTDEVLHSAIGEEVIHALKSIRQHASDPRAYFELLDSLHEALIHRQREFSPTTPYLYTKSVFPYLSTSSGRKQVQLSLFHTAVLLVLQDYIEWKILNDPNLLNDQIQAGLLIESAIEEYISQKRLSTSKILPFLLSRGIDPNIRSRNWEALYWGSTRLSVWLYTLVRWIVSNPPNICMTLEHLLKEADHSFWILAEDDPISANVHNQSDRLPFSIQSDKDGKKISFSEISRPLLDLGCPNSSN
jgi:hypothetical protein